MGCGKGEVVKILEEKGFKYVRLSSMVREEAKRRGVGEEREQLMEVGNSMRAAGGNGVLATKTLETIQSSDHDLWIVDGIRNPAEIDELQKGEGVHIVGVTADREMIVDRIMSRAREGDATTRQEIEAKMDREWGIGEPPEGQQVGQCMEKVDVTIENNGTLEELAEKFISYYNQISQ